MFKLLLFLFLLEISGASNCLTKKRKKLNNHCYLAADVTLGVRLGHL